MAAGGRSLLLGPLLWLCARTVGAQTGKPVSIPPSQFWDGKDGPWSTFRIEVGSPPQQVRVLPGSDKSATWLVDAELCKNNKTLEEYDSCSEARGLVYRRNDSTTWNDVGNYELDTFLEQRVGLSGNALYGNDKITLGWSGDAGATVDNQSIAGFITDDFSLGSLSLSPRPTNFTDYNNPVPSLLENLRNMSEPIPSLSWSYAAGAYNLSPKVYGSLVIGGYDTSRFEPNNMTFPFGDDQSLSLQVAIQEITTNVTEDLLLSSGIVSYISTLVADVWLPIVVCQEFEKAFGLAWDNETQLYLLNDTLHKSLLEKNPEIRFKVGPQVSGGSITFNLPYWNFYHTATEDLGASGLFFPLKRAANDSQYVLGRTFLQSVYLSVDYERSTFNLSQALFPSSSSDTNITAVLPPLEKTTPGAGGGGNVSGKSGLSTGAIAGIAVGAGAVVAIVAVGAFLLYRRKQAKTKDPYELDGMDHLTAPAQEVDGGDRKYEIGPGLLHEFPGDMDPKAELPAGEKPVEADGTNHPIYEMPGEGKLVEMPGESRHSKTPSIPFFGLQNDELRGSQVAETRHGDEVVSPLSGHSSGTRSANLG
ncbi:acid protease [Lentithecium fluviatile CBS 122367]|uniref:Acid protease n=1 Tax=Lentithecium fluviatile CBS 122367 TaxID=1168545 RepID=A0A6G1JM88_9PLEO|nr:acid protease [Lentithecium fluviatile CBS 122367]